MKSLQTIQKVSNVFKILCMIATIVSFLWALSSLMGLVCFAVWGVQGVGGVGQEIMAAIQAENLQAAVCVLLSDVVFAATDGVLFLLAWRYFQTEVAQGTPFTQNGTVKVRHLGISTIVMPNVAVVVAAVIYACCAVEPGPEWDTGASTLLGVVLIVLSLVLQYGVELQKQSMAAGETE